MYIYPINTLIGKLWLAADNQYLHRVSFTPLSGLEKSNAILKQTQKEINEYMQGARHVFSIPFYLKGTDFQMKVWNSLRCIPYGKVWNYSQLAEAAGYPKANRAVGNANHRNPLPIIIPCHRVISSDGKLCGYSGGCEIKQKLLNIETMVSL